MTEQFVLCLGVVAAMMLLWLHGRNERAASPDESYLWYGTQEVLRGRVPLRDFRSYEPGRYWFAAPFLWAKPGIRSSRFAATFFLTVCLCTLGLTMRANHHSALAITLLIVLVALWAFRSWKRFDQGVLLLLVSAAAWVMNSPNATPWFFAGIIVGLAAVFGLNHALYGIVATGGCALLAALQPEIDLLPNAFVLALGVLVGGLPLVIAAAFVRGFTSSLVRQRVLEPARRGSTNLPLPYPSPFGGAEHRRARQFPPKAARTASLLFSALPLGGTIVVVWALAIGQSDAGDHAVLVGASVVGLVAWHHVFSRADTGHLATVAPVFWAAAVATIDHRWWLGSILIIAIAAATYVVAVPAHDRVKRQRQPDAFVRPDLGVADELWFLTGDAPVLQLAARLDDESPPTTPWIAVPMTLWILPLVNRRSAVYNTFCVYPADPAAQAVMIREIENSGADVAFVGMGMLDQREDLRFTATHPDVWAHLQSTFEPVDPESRLPIQVLRRRAR